ncbi:MAG TPA: extracellular solute-binding protein [Acidimicrobiia bacterium]|nr:extracellular solute-binding protein [Acidimicrobiia bacterium]
MKSSGSSWIIGILLVPLLVGGCGVVDAFGGSDTVRVYSGRHYDLEEAFGEYAAETGVDVEFLYGGDAELRERLRTEGEDTLADVFMTVDAANLQVAADQDLLQPMDSDVVAGLPENIVHGEQLWVGLSKRVRTIMYNPDRVDPSELSTYEDLADPKWQGRLCMRHSNNVYTQSLVASLIYHHGYEGAREIVKGWVANDTQILSNDIVILETIAAGGCDVGITNHYYLARLLADDPEFPVQPFWANQEGRGVHVNISGAGVTAAADNPDLAVDLIEWLATDGQESFVYGNHEYPVNPDVEPPPVVREWGTFKEDTLNAAEFASLNADAIRLMNEAGYD